MKHIDEAIPHFAGSRERSRVEAVGPYPPASAEHAVHRPGKAYAEPLETSRKCASVLRLDHEVDVIGLDRELENPELTPGSPREPAANGQDDPLLPQGGQQAIGAKSHVHRMSPLVLRPSPVRDADLSSGRFAAGPAASPTPGAKTDLELARNLCHLNRAHMADF